MRNFTKYYEKLIKGCKKTMSFLHKDTNGQVSAHIFKSGLRQQSAGMSK